MITTNATFDTYNDATSKRPVWVLDFDGIATKFSSGTFSGITSSYKKYIHRCNVIPMTIKPLSFSTTFQGYDVTVQDDSSNTILGLLSANALHDIDATVKVGFQELTIGNFISMPTGRVIDIDIDSANKLYTFKIRNVLYEIQRPILREFAVATLTADVTDADTTLPVSDTTGFQTAVSAPWGTATSATFVMVGNELMQYSATTANTFTVVRGANGSEQTKHSAGEGVYEVFFQAEGSYFDLIMQLLTTTSAGTNGDWDIGLAKFGLGVDIDKIDYNQIRNELQEKKYHAASAFTAHAIIIDPWKEKNSGEVGSKIRILPLNFIYYATVKQEAYGDAGIDSCSDWISKNLFPQIHAYWIITGTGKLGVKTWDVRGSGEGIATVTQDEIIGVPEITVNSNDLINFYEINSDTNTGSRDNYNSSKLAECATSTVEYNDQQTAVLKSILIEEFDGTQRQLLQRILFGIYGNPVMEVKFEAFLKHQLLQAGDVINLTHDKLPNIKTNSIGWTNEPVIITSVGVDYKMGKIITKISGFNPYAIDHANINDITVYDSTDMDDSILTKDADSTENSMQAADAYIDGSLTATRIMVRIALTQPGVVGGSDHEYIGLVIQVQNPANTNIVLANKYMYYDETASDTIYAEFYTGEFASQTWSRVRVDWTGSSGANDPTSVTVDKVKSVNFVGTITEA